MQTNKEKAYDTVVNAIFQDELSGDRKYTKKEIQHMLDYSLAYQNNDPDMTTVLEYVRAKIVSPKKTELKQKIHIKYYKETNDMAKEIRENFDRIDRRYS